MKPNKLTIFLALFTAAILWSSSPVVNKLLLQTFNPMFIAFIRFAIASIFIFPFFLQEHHKNPPITLTLIGITLLATGNIGFFITGLQYTVPNASSALYATTPLLVALYARILIKEKLTFKKLIGLILGLIGVLTVIVIPALKHNQNIVGSPFGNLIIFIAVNTWTGYAIGSRYLVNKKGYSSQYIMFISFFGATIIFGILNLLQGSPNSIKMFETNNFLLFIYMAIAITIVTYFLYQWIIKHSSASTASLMGYIQPPTTFLLAWIFLGDKLSVELIVGASLALLGVFIIANSKTR